MNFGRLIGAGACAVVFGLATQANGISFDLYSSGASMNEGNINSLFYEPHPAVGSTAAYTLGTAKDLYSTTFGGDDTAGFWVNVAFGSNPKPVLESAFLKAGNSYLLWNDDDLKAFNNPVPGVTYDSITLWNSGSGGIQNPPKNAYLGTSHAGLNGSPGTTSVPDGGMTIMLLGMALGGLGYARRLVK